MRSKSVLIILALIINVVLSSSALSLDKNQWHVISWTDLILKGFSVEVAPVEPTLDGKVVRLPGYVVPLEMDGEKISEFLLVPYAGACIHTPPPPANQIVHVIAKEPFEGAPHRQAVWVNGKMTIKKQVASVGYYNAESSYLLVDAEVEPYKSK